MADQRFFETGETEELDLFPKEDILTILPQSQLDYMARTLSPTVGKDYEAVSTEVQLGFLPAVMEESRTNNKLRIYGDITTRLRSDEPVSPEELEQFSPTIDAVSNSIIPDDDSFIFDRTANLASETERLKHHRMNTFKRLFQEEMNQSDQGWFDAVGYFLDTVISVPKDLIEGGGFTRGNMAESIISMVSDPSLTELEFQEKARALVKEAMDAGMFSDYNPFYGAQLLEDIESGSGLDKFFTTIDAITLGAGLIPKRLLQSVDAVDHLTVLRPNDEATQAVLNSVVSEFGTGVDSVRHTSPVSQRAADPNKYWFSSPDAEALRTMEVNNRVLNFVDGLDWGHYIQPEVWDVVKPQIAEDLLGKLTSGGTRRYVSHDIKIGPLGNPVATFVFGKDKGGYFLSKNSAQKLANEVTGEVIETVENGRTVWGVKKEMNIPTQKMTNPTDENELVNNALQYIGSPMLTTSYRLDSILKRAEGQTSAVFKAIAQKYNKSKRKVSSDDKAFINQLYDSIRDGAESYRTQPVSTEEFINRYTQHFNVAPAPLTVEYHRMIQELNDTAYLMIADPRFKQAVNDGQKVLLANNTTFRAKPVKELDEIDIDDVIYDLDDAKHIRKDKAEGKSIFAVVGGFEGPGNLPYKFVATKAPKTRRLYHNDVVPYNAGGPRIYEEFRFWGKQETEIAFPRFAQSGKLAEPEVFGGVPRTFMGFVTQKEAQLAIDEMNNLFEGLKRFGLIDSRMPNNLAILRGLENDPEVVNFIRTHNNWNTQIETPGELANFLEKYRLDINKKVDIAHSGEPLQKNIASDAHRFFLDTDNANTYLDQLVIKTGNRHRRPDPLLGYGGLQAEIFSPIEAAERVFARAINMQRNQAYNFNAVQGWLKGAANHILNWNDIKNLRPYDQLVAAKLSGVKQSRLYDQEREIIKRRVESKSGFVREWENAVTRIADFVYDKGHKKMGIKLKNAFSSDPTVALRTLAFDLKLGLFAFPQLLVQANQAVNVMAIGGRNGMKGAASMLPLRLALYNGHLSVAKEIGKRASPFTGMSGDEFVELVEFINRSGRDVVDFQVIEQARDFEFALSVAPRIRQAGRIFFNEGEKLPRLAAAATAYLEFKKLFPGQSLLSARAELWMAHRMDVLTASMTKASAARWQVSSLASIPLQFMSYSSRMVEQIFASNRILTPSERARLGLVQLTMWGLSGYGLGSVLNWLVNEGEIEVDNDSYTLLRYGLLDYIIGEATGSRTAFGERYSFGEGFFDVFTKITEKQFLEVIGGASATVAKDVWSSGLWLLGDVVHGRTNMVGYDGTRFVRSLSSANTMYNSWMMYNYGKYLSRDGAVLADKLGTADAVFNFLGAPLQDITLTYDVIQYNKHKDELLQEHGRRLQEMMMVAEQKYREGDISGGEALLRDIGAQMTVLDPYERDKVKTYLRIPTMTVLDTVIKKMLDQGYSRGLVQGTFLDEENIEKKE